MLHFIEVLKQRNPTLLVFSAICFALAFLFLLLAKVAPIQFAGVNAWLKPFKFAMSIGLYCITMAWYCQYLINFSIARFNWVTIILLGFELFYIALQASRAQASHFNISTPLYATLYSLMGTAAVLVTIYTAYIGVLFFVQSFPDLPTAYLWAIRLGIIIFVIFSLEGGLMGGRMSHSVGATDVDAASAATIPILTWSRTIGDLRVAHFIGMHALQVLPLLAYYLIRDTRIIVAISVLYLILATYTFIQALQGRPFVK